MAFVSDIAARGYQASRPATAPDPTTAAGPVAARAAQDFAATLRAGEDTAIQAIGGAAEPHALVQAVAESKLAVEIAVAVRDKVVEAYQEILRMPV